MALKRSLLADREMLAARTLIALPDGSVVCGNQRLLAARELGWETIPAIVVNLDEERAAVWALRDNNGYGEWDDTLASFFSELAGEGVDLDLAGFAPVELERLLAAAAADLSEAERVRGRDAARRKSRNQIADYSPRCCLSVRRPSPRNRPSSRNRTPLL